MNIFITIKDYSIIVFFDDCEKTRENKELTISVNLTKSPSMRHPSPRVGNEKYQQNSLPLKNVKFFLNDKQGLLYLFQLFIV